MKKYLKILICFIVFIFIGSMILHSFNQKSFPDKYESICNSFFKDWKIEEIVHDDIAFPKKYLSKVWKINFDAQLSKETFIEDEMGFFLALQKTYVQQNMKYIQEELGDKNIRIDLRNAYDRLLDKTYDNEYIAENDNQIMNKYTQYYPKKFNVYEENTILNLFEQGNAPLYYVFICNNQETANKFMSQCKNLNAIIRIIGENEDIDSIQIEDAYLADNPNDYIFIYNGQIINNASTIMSVNYDEKDDNDSYQYGTIMYNFNKFIQDQLEK